MWKLFAFLALIATFLVIIWFKDGLIMGTAEGVLPFYNLSRYFSQSQYAWAEHPGLGSFTSAVTASKPTYWLLSFIQNQGVEGFIIQALTFWFFLVSAGIGISLLIKFFFPNTPKRYILFGALFYWFNPIFLVNIWNRFLLNYTFFFAMMPIVCYLFLKGLKTKKIIYSLILTLTFALFSYTFSSYAFLILIWLILSLLFIFYFLTAKDKASKVFYVKFFLISLILFILSNLWWISQISTYTFSGTFQNISGNLFTTDINSGILKALSEKMGNLTDILRFINISFYTSSAPLWVSIYNSPIIIFLHAVIILGILFVSFSQISNHSVLMLTSLFFLSIFLSKGTNPPVGEIYDLLFQKIKFIQVFRNPFEKFSLLMPLFSAALFSFSIFYYSRRFPRLKVFIELFVLAILIFWSYPYFSGLVFTNTSLPKEAQGYNYKVQVPAYYNQANEWMEAQEGNFRFLGMPISDEGITYFWPKGYNGADLPSTLFSIPGITFNTSVPYYSKLVPHLDKLFYESEDFSKIANILNIKYYIVRSDIDWQGRSLKNPEEALTKLYKMQNKSQALKVADFGKLSIWENLNYIDGTFYIANTIFNQSSLNPADIELTDVKGHKAVVNGQINVPEKDETKEILPEIRYQKINPTKYKVQIKDAKKPFLLIFSELFDPNWQAKINKQTLSQHYLTNTYANGWWIEENGTFDIAIEFLPQKYLDIGQKASITTILIIIILTGLSLKGNLWKR